MLRLARFVRAFSTTIEGSRTVPELVNAIKSLGSLSAEHVSRLETRSMELLSDNAKEASMLLLTLKAFNCDLTPMLSRMDDSLLGSSDGDVLFRALVECGQVPNVALLDKFRQANNGREIANLTCGYSKLVKSGAMIANAAIIDAAREKITGFGLCNFRNSELVDIASHLAIFQDEEIVALLKDICSVLRDACLETMPLPSLVEFVQSVYICPIATEILEARLEEFFKVNGMYYDDKKAIMDPKTSVGIVFIYGKMRRHNLLILDKLMICVRRQINAFTLDQLTRIIISLSSTGYRNQAITRLIARVLHTHVDEDSILDPCLITNLYTGFSRFNHRDEKLYKLLATIVAKEEVLAEFKIQDLVAIIHAYSRLYIVDEHLFSTIEEVLIKSRDLNTHLATKLLNAFAKLDYCNAKTQNLILECINLGDLDTILELQKLRLSVAKLGLYFPELDEKLSGVTPEEGKLPRIVWRSCSSPRIRRFQHVRKRKWTW
ncbi:conserved hypothetical protein [Theileria equi strain WA]|uniref:RNA-editing substrate-binding complex 6 protein domain-containing protein n=1 Tax=Theileria equi strain WA TaxID=1537102 RepID=L1LDR8_THEEQ|nr:conserved hypothetical protein [Theileria equi strain WA]EKX73283.1 conserved hypothetical protein [Theileria equi strain WA]|eukprot:XP_004832735.1 conserved hypothetical protein [Theileria equi strain WA]